MIEFDYKLDYKKLKFEPNDKRYRIGRGEQGVLLVRPYTDDICTHWKFKTPNIAEKSSRQVTQQMICHYLKKHVGDQFNAVVTGMADFGLFAEIDNFFVSGLIHVTDLPGDRYFHDKDANILRGRKTGRVYKLGQNIMVTIANVSPEERKISLVPEKIFKGKKK